MLLLKSFCLLFFGLFLFACASGGEVRIFDRGLNMEIASYQLPAGWKVDHRIVSDLQNDHRFFSAYQFDFLGPQGEVFRNVSPVRFSPLLGQSFASTWQIAIHQRMSSFGQFELSSPTQSRYARFLFPQLSQLSDEYFVESIVRGRRNGKSFEGICVGILANGPYSGQFVAVIILAPQGQLEQTLMTYQQIQASKQENRQYSMAINQLNQQKNQRVLAQHNAFMASQRQIYARHRQNMENLYASRQQSNTSPTYSSSEGNQYGSYTTQDQYNDHYKGTTSFDDAYLGYRVPVGGEYDIWYTDNLGHYYGTNDDGFKPASLGTNWQRTEPVR